MTSSILDLLRSIDSGNAKDIGESSTKERFISMSYLVATVRDVIFNVGRTFFVSLQILVQGLIGIKGLLVRIALAEFLIASLDV